MAQINFVPPAIKTYKITQARGNSKGEKIVRELLDRETESAKKGPGSEINRTNYDFVFLRQEQFGLAPEYVLRIVPKRKDKYLLRGQIWVDANTGRMIHNSKTSGSTGEQNKVAYTKKKTKH